MELLKGSMSFIKTFACGGASCTLEQENSVNRNPETSEELSYNQTGEMLFISPGNLQEYYRLHNETKELIDTDCAGVRWIRTGDLGENHTS